MGDCGWVAGVGAFIEDGGEGGGDEGGGGEGGGCGAEEEEAMRWRRCRGGGAVEAARKRCRHQVLASGAATAGAY